MSNHQAQEEDAMRTRITDTGLLLPKEWFPDTDEVEIHRQNNRIVIVPVHPHDPLYDLGKQPVLDEITDASEKHDQYLSNS